MKETNKIHEEVRVFRFSSVIDIIRDGRLWGMEIRAANPVPVYAETNTRRLLGFAYVEESVLSSKIVVKVALDPHTPERLDLELGNPKYWLDAFVEYRGIPLRSVDKSPRILYVKGLSLTTKPMEGHDPIDVMSLDWRLE